MRTRLKIFFDGGCRPNPGRMEAAVVARGGVSLWPDLGHGSNSDAEWLALIHALTVGQSLGVPFDLLGDSAVVINQATGIWPCRDPRLQAYRDTFLALAADGAPGRIRKIGRAQNLAGVALAKTHAR